MKTCLGFHVECDVLLKGAGVTIMSFILFVGSVYILLAAIFGRWMGYLVMSVAFYGWMILLAAMWYFGFWAQGPTTKTNLGPRGLEPAWVPLEGGLDVADQRFETFASYPEAPWKEPTDAQEPSVLSVSSEVTTFLAEQANEELGHEEGEQDAILNTQFTIDDMRFARGGGHLPVGRPSLLQRRWPPRDGDAVSRQRQRPAVLADVPGRIDPAVRHPSTAAGPGGEEAQGVPDRRQRAALVRPCLGLM